jgi:hypothetical protein
MNTEHELEQLAKDLCVPEPGMCFNCGRDHGDNPVRFVFCEGPPDEIVRFMCRECDAAMLRATKTP